MKRRLVPAAALSLLAAAAFAAGPGPSSSAKPKGQPPPVSAPAEPGPGRPFITNVTGADSGFAAPIPERSTEAVDRERSQQALAMDGDIPRTPQGLKATPKPQPAPVDTQPQPTAERPVQKPEGEGKGE